MIQRFQGKSPKLGQNVYIAPSAIVIGDVTLGDDVSIWPNAVLRGDIQSIVVGQGSNIQDGSVIHVDPNIPTVIGQGVTVGHMVHIHGATIGDHVIIGSTAVILDGAHIHRETIVGAGSLVVPRQEIPSHVLMTGRPAQVKRALTDTDLAHIRENALEYIRLNRLYSQEESHD